MGIDLRTMTPEEFDVFYRWSMENHILELMEEENLSRDAAYCSRLRTAFR